MSEVRRVGWIGTGIMGVPMAGHLLEAGYPFRRKRRRRSCAALFGAIGRFLLDGPEDEVAGLPVGVVSDAVDAGVVGP